MIVVKDYPPNIAKIRAKFGDLPKTVLFTYGETIYNPSGNPIDDPLDVHERTHKFQQGDDPEGWWNKYLEDDQFRLEQELQAYSFQYKKFCELHKDRNVRFGFLSLIAKDLSSAIYGNICTEEEAMKLIKEKAK